jgi:hypothetical protein
VEVARAYYDGDGGGIYSAPALRITPVAAEGVGASPPSDGWVWEDSMQWLDGGGRAWQWRLCVTSIGTRKAPFYGGFFYFPRIIQI